MPKQERIQTKYPGVYYVIGNARDGRPEKIYYIRYRRNGKSVDEKAGRQFQDDMTPARAAGLRTNRLEGNEQSNIQRRERERLERDAEQNRWTINRLWEEYQRQRSENKGLHVDANRFHNHIEAVFGEKTPDEIITLDVDRLRLKLMKIYKPQSVKHVLALLRRLINFGVQKGLVHHPDRSRLHIEMPKVNNQRTEDLDPDELLSFLDAIEKDQNQIVANLLKLALFTGMRKSELLRLQWNDIDFHRGFIHIRASKGGVPQRIPMNQGAREILRDVPRTKSIYVFPGKHGGQLINIMRVANRIKKRAGLPENFRPLHGLRHAYASMLASSGKVDMYTLQKLLTHKSPQMTQRYAHLRDDALKRAADTADEIFSGMTKHGS